LSILDRSPHEQRSDNGSRNDDEQDEGNGEANVDAARIPVAGDLHAA
jgi:hypothetical protein